ncbi:MAG TPA: hypothetical protein PKC21_02420 [Oligoflexia bacterium]|nr:hypothetical protein [Oligoflexia bacterium]HMR24186.1 hypothetical protein [Oligoflexia bacterium]
MSHAVSMAMRKIKEVLNNDNKQNIKLSMVAMVLCSVLAFASSVEAKTLAVSEDFKVSIESITDGNVDQALMRFLGSDQCSVELIKKRHELDKEQIDLAIAAAQNGPLLDENSEGLNLENRTIQALKQCAEDLKTSLALEEDLPPSAVLEIYALANG